MNSLFLSCRFEAERDGPYNEFVYNFFRSLSIERMEYTERYYAESAAPMELWEAGGYAIQRRCPHLQGRPHPLRLGRGRHPHLRDARLALRARDRAVPHLGRPSRSTARPLDDPDHEP